MVFSPDVEALLKRPSIDKPHEEFVLPSPEPSLVSPPETKSVEELVSKRDLLNEVLDEAAVVSDLYDLIVNTAEDVSFDVPEEDQLLIGSSINTKDYIDAIPRNDHKSERIKHRFEEGVLGNCGKPDTAWSVLPLVDLHDIRQGLLNVASSVEGQLLIGPGISNDPSLPDWGDKVLDTHLREISRSYIDTSKQYRVRLGEVIVSMRADFRSEILNRIINPIVRTELRNIRPTLKKILNLLHLMKSLLCHAMLLRSIEFLKVRQALLTLVKKQVISTLLNSLLSLLHKAQQTIVLPFLDALIEGVEGISILDDITDRRSREVLSALGASIESINNQYSDIAADIIRSIDAESQKRLTKLQNLGERNVFGRWIRHIDQAITLINYTLNVSNITEEITLRLANEIFKPPAPLDSKVREAIEDREEYSSLSPNGFETRLLPFIPSQHSSPVASLLYTPDGTQSRTDTISAYSGI